MKTVFPRYSVKTDDHTGKLFCADEARPWAQIGNSYKATVGNRTRLAKLAEQLNKAVLPEPTLNAGGNLI